jgi:hypothetical protein
VIEGASGERCMATSIDTAECIGVRYGNSRRWYEYCLVFDDGGSSVAGYHYTCDDGGEGTLAADDLVRDAMMCTMQIASPTDDCVDAEGRRLGDQNATPDPPTPCAAHRATMTRPVRPESPAPMSSGPRPARSAASACALARTRPTATPSAARAAPEPATATDCRAVRLRFLSDSYSFSSALVRHVPRPCVPARTASGVDGCESRRGLRVADC